MIIRLILGDKSYRVKTPADAPVDGMQLLLVSKVVCNEALAVLRETATCKLDFEAPIRSKSKAALRLFRLFSVDVLVRRPYFKWGNKSDRLRKLWSMMKEELLDGHDNTDKHAQINLQLNFSVRYVQTLVQDMSLDNFHPEQEYGRNVLWREQDKILALFWKQQLKLFVIKAQEDLKLDFANGGITSNVDVDWPSWRVCRKEENRIWCYNAATGAYHQVSANPAAYKPTIKAFNAGHQLPSVNSWPTA